VVILQSKALEDLITTNIRDVSYWCSVTLPFTLKSTYLEENEQLWKFKYFTMQKYIIVKKKSSERNQNPSRYNNCITNLKFQHKPKYHLSKILV
jgi:hypothetical protein